MADDERITLSHADRGVFTDPAPVAPPSAPEARSSGRPARRAALLLLLLAGVIVGTVIGAGGARVVGGRILPARQPSVAAAGADAAVVDVIRRANEEQQRAVAAKDPTVMRDTATSAHYDEMVAINADLARAGVTAIELVDLRAGPVTVNGDGAEATTTETWRVTYADGSTDEHTDENHYTLVREGGSWKIASDDQPGSTATDGGTPGAAPAPAGGTTPVRAISSNWAGYVATGGSFTSVTGTWTVPSVSASSAGADATWVGIGGERTSDLIQAGTQAVVSGGSVEYGAWIETLPQSTRSVPLTVSAGDSITVTLSETSSGLWSIAMKNNTTAQTYQTTVRYASSRSSAEWIEEAPSTGRSIVPLDDFGTVRFTQAGAVRDGTHVTLSGAGATAVTLSGGTGQALATPSAISSDGTGFTVTRTSAPASGTGVPGPRPRRG